MKTRGDRDLEMGKLRPVTFPYDLWGALKELAGFINSTQLGLEYRYPDGADKRSFEGYWQPIEFFYKLKGYAHEALRVAGN